MPRFLRCLMLTVSAAAGCAGIETMNVEFEVDPSGNVSEQEALLASLSEIDPTSAALEGMYAVRQLKELARKRPVVRKAGSDGEAVDLTGFPCTHSPIATGILIRSTPRGSRIHCRNTSDRACSGLLAMVSEDEVVLTNCVYSAVSHADDGEAQTIVSYSPFVSLPLSSLITMWVFSVPQDDAEASRLLQQDRNDVVREVVFMSGRRHRLDAEPDKDLTAAANGGVTSLAELPAGSLVRFCDRNGRRAEGTVLGTEEGMTSLRNCVCRAVVQGPDNEWQEKTSVLPFTTIPASDVRGVVQLKSPPPGFDPDSEDDCCDHCVAAFVMDSGRREMRGIPSDEDEVQ